MGINDLPSFDFMDPPPAQTMLAGLESLYALSALDDEGLLTKLGYKMANFPLEPTLAKTLIASVELGYSEEVLTIVAMLSVPAVFYRPKEKQREADAKKAKFNQPEGDHLTLLTGGKPAITPIRGVSRTSSKLRVCGEPTRWRRAEPVSHRAAWAAIDNLFLVMKHYTRTVFSPPSWILAFDRE